MKAQHLLVLAVALILTACGGGGAATSSSVQFESGAAASQPAAAATAAAASAPMPAAGGAALDPYAAPEREAAADAIAEPQTQLFDRLIIKTADLSLQVANVGQAEAAIRAKVVALNGYIVQVQSSGSDEFMTTYITFRVPSDQFEAALTGVEGLADEVLSRTLGGSDVTEEFVDLESQLRNLQATRDRLQSFLDKATTVSDALAVNQSLSDIQGQIERIQGRMTYLQKSADMSTITVNLQPVPTTSIVAEDGWRASQVAVNALSGLLEFGQGLATLAIVLLVWTPVWLPLVMGGWWVRGKVLQRLGKPRTVGAQGN